jgi:hypothetical protein
MKKSWALAVALMVAASLSAMGSEADDARLRKIILHSRHWGAHGLGYNSESMKEMARKLNASDVASLILLLQERKISVGAEFALASQCEAAIEPLHRAAEEKKAEFMASEEVMDLIGGNDDCPAQARKTAQEMKVELAAMREAEDERVVAEARKREANDQRIQENGLKMMDPARRGELTLEERKEVFERSVKAAGLEHPTTAAQKEMVDRMYRTRVLEDKAENKTPN